MTKVAASQKIVKTNFMPNFLEYLKHAFWLKDEKYLSEYNLW